VHLPLAKEPVPAAVVLHPLQMGGSALEGRLCRALNKRGIAALLMELPYHMSRQRPGTSAQDGFLSDDFSHSTATFEQSLADVSGCVDWLTRQPEIDGSRIGIVGISLGAILGLSASQHESRFVAAASILGAGDLPTLYAEGFLTAPRYQSMKRRGISKQSIRNWLGDLDPLYAAGKNPDCRIYMIAARRDPIIPSKCVKKTWEAFGRPPISWLPNSGHHSAFLAMSSMFSASAEFLAVQFGLAKGPFSPPTFRTPHLRIGVNYSPTEGTASPTVVLGLYPIDANAILVLDLGAWLEGMFAGISARVHDRAVIGAGYPITGSLDDPFLYIEGSVTF
jgi:dienelactone hydrolase